MTLSEAKGHPDRALKKNDRYSRIQDKAAQKMAIFEKNPFVPRLKTHKLKGELQNYWSYSITRSYRILFRFLNKNKVL